MSFECVDGWTPGTATEAVLCAYKQADTDGLIKVTLVEVSAKTGRVVMHYSSQKPHDETLILLREIKRTLTEGVKST